ncbi:MAG: hypothetical protein JRN15_00900 [Nitrososphaerota archaeon]|nr:hypothetical protein [Nitrososphaerota archaeon]
MSTPARDKNILTPSERVGEIVGVTAIWLLIAFFVYHQVSNTGFFTSRFALLEEFLFYGAALVGMAAPIVRALTGRRKTARWFELGSGIFWAVTSAWLLFIFPFNFTHLADALPGFLEFSLSWVTNFVGRIVLMLTLLGSIASILIQAVRIAQERVGAQGIRAEPEKKLSPNV